MSRITYGCDPEFFFIDPHDHSVPVCGWLGGSKESPLPLHDCFVQEDGVAAELTIPPQTSPESMVARAQVAVSTITRHANKKRAVYPRIVPTQLFSKAALDAAGEAAHRFGCSPDFDCYTGGQQNPLLPGFVEHSSGGQYRFAGGHIHIGYKDIQPYVPEHAVALLCDFYIGLGLVAAGERQGMRRSMYGRPGMYRPTHYGVEYRTPSNLWLVNPALEGALVTGLACLSRLLDGTEADIRAKWNSIDWPSVQKAIANEDHKAAAALWRGREE